MAILDGLRTKYVFIDESGNTSIATDKDGASRLYIPVAIVIDSEKIHEAYAKAEEIRKNFFNNKPIKSASAKKDYRRLNILKEINNIDFNYFYFVVDKTLIKPDTGLGYRRSFYKFINKQLYSYFLNTYSKLKIFVDNYGDTTFEDSFKKYIQNKFDMDLFNEPEIGYISGKDDNLIGLADFISGTLRRILENNIEEKRQEIINAVKLKGIYGDRWPSPKKKDIYEDVFQGFDNFIRDVSVRNALDFIDRNISSQDTNIRMQVAILNKLRMEVTINSEDRRGLYTDELIKYLSDLDFHKISERTFRQNVIGPLRDAGILIAGSSKGYYLAANIQDVKKFLEHGNNIILPMLKRIEKAYDTLKVASTGECDIFDKKIGDYEILKTILITVKDKKIGLEDQNVNSNKLEEKLNEIEQKEQEQNVSTEKLSE